MRDEEVFEIRVDGKLVYTKRRGKGVYLHMETIDQVRHTDGTWLQGIYSLHAMDVRLL